MAKVVLPFESYKVAAPLPPVCIRCGAPATRTTKMQFFAKANSEEEYCVVDTPLCDRHPFMGMGKLFTVFGFLLLIPFFGLGALMKIWTHHYLIAFPLGVLCLGWVVTILYVSFTSIGGNGYTKKGVTVTGVSRKFIDALEEREWTEEDFTAGVRKNRKARGPHGQPFWISPWFFVPVAIVLAFVIFTPIGWLVASYEPSGSWPAGFWARRAQTKSGAPVEPQPQVVQPQGGQPQGGQPPQPQLPVVQQQPEPMVPDSLPGLIAYWPLDENEGGTTNEKIGKGLTSLRGAKWVEGVKGSALQFDGEKQHLDLGRDGRLNFAAGAPFTIAGWIATAEDEGVIFSFRRRTNAFPVIELLVKSGQVHGWVRDEGSGFGGARVSGGAVKDRKWHHVALVRHADGTVELFLDAVSQARDKGQHSGGSITTDLRTLGADRFVGKAKRPTPPAFAGNLDEFCVYNRALTVEEITILVGGKK